MQSLKDLQRSLFVSGNAARIESILKTLESGQELENEELRWAIELSTTPRDRSSTSDAWLHDEYISPVLSRAVDLVIVGGDPEERLTFATYLKEIQGRLLSRSVH
jgi:hypothetical protein